MKRWKVGILLFDDVEVLDFAGPFEVFAVTTAKQDDGELYSPFEVTTISEDGQMITARNGLKVQPDYSFGTAPAYDLLVIPGGMGTRGLVHNKVVVAWIAERFAEVQWMTSVCTGAFLLAEADLLEGKRATTHWASIERMRDTYPTVIVEEDVKFVDEDRIVTSAGISAGINMAFHMVSRLLGKEVAMETARTMEYDIDLNRE
ncbi:DJ-1/PfpI family protein [Paenibacillus lutimineralis]|uniref:DJ-1/PfpI family protein n=1 Tax=Paenibacillus lutimineralis TaxID=2707005 RepID=A0A3S9UTX6_9BACL|nr:DJ-1/PfpI family protein [Paenibacillus lutimineralis]AZS13766.1 DJ-1/PfpI family protein [Paenibacillus lutimineralis]